jgi:hypothetical protein
VSVSASFFTSSASQEEGEVTVTVGGQPENISLQLVSMIDGWLLSHDKSFPFTFIIRHTDCTNTFGMNRGRNRYIICGRKQMLYFNHS